MTKEVFISYSSKNETQAFSVCDYIESKGIGCWIAPRDIAPGKEYGEEIVIGLENCKTFVLIYSKESSTSPHVLREIERAVSKNLKIICYKIEDAPLTKSLEYFLLATQWIDASSSEKYQELVDSLIGIRTKNKTNTVTPVKNSNNKHTGLLASAIASVVILGIAGTVFLSGAFKDKNTDSSKSTETSAISQTQAGDDSTQSQEVAVSAQTQKKIDIDIDSLKVGDCIDFGEYTPQNTQASEDNSAIRWLVLDINKDTNEVTLITKNIIDMKPFDVAESGDYSVTKSGKQAELGKDANSDFTSQENYESKGNNNWDTSNIKTWLNSDSEMVTYDDCRPANAATDDNANGYDTQSGFLYEFTDSEKDMLVDNSYGKVFLLSQEQKKKYFDDQNISPYTEPTEAAKQSDNSTYYVNYSAAGIETFAWLLRDAVNNTDSYVQAVGANDKNSSLEVMCASSGIGIRPAIVIKITE